MNIHAVGERPGYIVINDDIIENLKQEITAEDIEYVESYAQKGDEENQAIINKVHEMIN